jgi:hypothetical protein
MVGKQGITYNSTEQRKERLEAILGELIYDFITERLPLSERNNTEALLNGGKGGSL